jgi:hypothetical protein
MARTSLGLIWLVMLTACSEGAASREPGFETGPCIDAQCLDGLSCLSNLCVDPDSAEGTETVGTTTTGDPEGTRGGNTAADETSSGAIPADLPAAFRFDCIDVRQLGEPAEDLPLQAQVLENAWSADINDYKLNIILEVQSRDDAAGTAQLGIRSGVGFGADDQCFVAESASEIIDIGWDPAVSTWAVADEEVCSTPATASLGGDYSLQLSPADRFDVYAEDDDGTMFNCTPDPAVFDAVPIRAVAAQVTANATGDGVAGELTGCLLETEADSLCSCLVECSGEGLQTEGECAGCPTGGTSLRNLLGNIAPSARCTTLMGENAFDLRIAFSASALPQVPPTCG